MRETIREFFRGKALALQTLKQITTLVTDCYNNLNLNMLIKLKIMRESNSKQLSRYNLLNASYKTTSAAPVTTNCRPTVTTGRPPD